MNRIFTSRKVQRASLAVLLLLMAATFYFSSQNGTESTAVSDSISRMIGADYSEDVASYVVFSGIRIRKFIHFVSYFIMGAAAYLCLKDRKRFLGRSVIAVVICVLFACSDELHQYFVPGRTCMLYDVMIDSCGILPACGILTLLNCISHRNGKT